MSQIDTSGGTSWSELKSAYVDGSGTSATGNSSLRDDSTTSAISLSLFREATFTSGDPVPAASDSEDEISINDDFLTTESTPTLNKASYSNNEFTRLAQTGGNAYEAQALFAASPSGSANIQFTVTQGTLANAWFIGLIASTSSPLASNAAQWYPNMHALNYSSGKIRQWTLGSLAYQHTHTISNTDVLKISYSGTNISYYLNGVVFRSDPVVYASDLIFPGKIENYVYPSDGADEKEFESISGSHDLDSPVGRSFPDESSEEEGCG